MKFRIKRMNNRETEGASEKPKDPVRKLQIVLGSQKLQYFSEHPNFLNSSAGGVTFHGSLAFGFR